MIFEGNAKKTIAGIVKCFNALGEERIERIYNNRIDKYNVADIETEKGKTVAIETNNRFYPLNSIYDPDEASRQWVEQFDKPEINENSVIIVFGMADGKSLLKLSQLKRDCKIIVYEPCQEIFWKAMNYNELVELAENENVCITVKGVNDEFLFHALQTVVNYSNYQLVVQAVLPNYLQIFKKEYQEMLDIYMSVIELIIFTRNTMILRGVEIQHNTYELTGDMLEHNSTSQLVDIVEKKKMNGIPAVLVAAGPSLDKNVRELVNIKDKAFLMVVDTALNTVLEHGITPDMTMSIDSRKPLVLFKNDKFKYIPIALAMNSNKDVVKLNKAKHFYEIDEQSYLKKMLDDIGKDTIQLPTGGSVATSALALLHEMGFKTIILVGQDLAYPGGVEHTDRAYGKGNDKINPQKKEYIEVEDNYGNMVLTEANMNIYRKWIENYIAAYDDLKVINATEGGAKIIGTEFISLKEAIKRYCANTYDISEILNVGTYLNGDEKEYIIKQIKNIPDKIAELEDNIKEMKKIYSKMDSLNAKGKSSSSQMVRAMDGISQMTEHIEENYVTSMLQAYMAKTDYEIQGEVLKYSENDSPTKLVNDLVEQGRKMLAAYECAIENLKEDMPLIMKNFK